MVIFVTGLPGTGKTYFAERLATEWGAVHRNTDGTRRQMGLMGQYDRATKERVYQGLKERMLEALANGKDVIVDGTFSRKAVREDLFRAAEERDEALRILYMTAREDVIKERVSRDRPDSEAQWEAYVTVRDAYEPFDRPYTAIDSSDGDVEKMIEKARTHLSS